MLFFTSELKFGNNFDVGIDYEVYGPVTIGENVMMGPEVVIYTSGHKHDWLETLRKKFPDYISYCGLISFEKSVETLKEYFALLLPTYYEGEGFAGTLIGAYSAGVPVIASDWKYNVELVNENVGYVYKTRDNVAFTELLNAVATDPTMILKKKKSCLYEAKKYTVEETIKTLEKQLRI